MPKKLYPSVGMSISVSQENADRINSQATEEKNAIILHTGLSWQLVATWDMCHASGFKCIVKGNLSSESRISLEIDDNKHKYICTAS